MYNRSKLTRLVVDKEWDKLVWEDSWEKRSRQDKINVALGSSGTDALEHDVKSSKKIRKRAEEAVEKPSKSKKRKFEDNGRIWGEKLSEEDKAKDKAREAFLKDLTIPTTSGKAMIQQKILTVGRAELTAMSLQ